MYREDDFPFTDSQAATTAGAEPIRSQEPAALPGLPHRCRIPRLWAILDCIPRSQAGLLGLEPMPIWDPGTCKVRNLATRLP